MEVGREKSGSRLFPLPIVPRALSIFSIIVIFIGDTQREPLRSQVNNREAQGGQQDSMVFIKIRLVRLFTALEIKTRKRRAIFTTEETKTTTILRARKKKEKQTTKFTSVATSNSLQISYSCNNSESSPIARYSVMDSLQLNKRALGNDKSHYGSWKRLI